MNARSGFVASMVIGWLAALPFAGCVINPTADMFVNDDSYAIEDMRRYVDLGARDMPQNMDLGRPDMPQSMDLGRQDMPQYMDLATPDQTAYMDLATPDQTAYMDLATPDQTAYMDLARPDLTAYIDMRVQPDLAVPADMSVLPDLRSSCSHSACVPGAKLDPTCDPCAATLCNNHIDTYCCTHTWDIDCAFEAYRYCQGTCPADPSQPAALAGFAGVRQTVQSIQMDTENGCAVSTAGEAWCWGKNEGGQIGDGVAGSDARPFPRKVPGLQNVLTVVPSGTSTCALMQSGDVLCWGMGELGNGMINVAQPSPPAAAQRTLAGASALFGAYGNFCAVVQQALWCWGPNNNGEIGPNLAMPQHTPKLVSLAGTHYAGALTVTGASMGPYHSCALLTGGSALCFGLNDEGELGDDHLYLTTPLTCLPASPPAMGQTDCDAPLQSVQSMVLGISHSCAVLGGGDLDCWGTDYDGELGDATTRNLPVTVPQSVPVAAVLAVAADSNATCVIYVDKQRNVQCWGNGTQGYNLGPNEIMGANTVPVDVPGTDHAAQIVMRASTVCITRFDGSASCWGSNALYQTGNADNSIEMTPETLQFLATP